MTALDTFLLVMALMFFVPVAMLPITIIYTNFRRRLTQETQSAIDIQSYARRERLAAQTVHARRQR
jgi:hypothetical protein